jgi:hypothetical protein
MPFDNGEKMKRHKEAFPLDCQKAFEMGARLAQEAALKSNKEALKMFLLVNWY